MNATETVNFVLMAALPPNVPPSFKRIISAHFIGSGKNRIASAKLEMFDGLSATVECRKYSDDSWSHHWLEMEGGNAFWNGQQWERVTQ